MTRRIAAVAICLLLPLSLAAADPRGDAAACRGTHGGGDPPDLVAASGSAGEEGSTAIWRLTFAEPLRVPDPVDPPFRVDVVIRDPKVPAVSYGSYRRFNRIVRFDATTADARVELLFIPEGGHTLFDPPVIDGDTMTIEMPGRLLLGTDLFGRVDLQRLRWSVVVRDGGRCDLLGDGVPSLGLTGVRAASASATPPPPDEPVAPASGSGLGVIAIVIAIIAAVAGIAVAALRRRR